MTPQEKRDVDSVDELSRKLFAVLDDDDELTVGVVGTTLSLVIAKTIMDLDAEDREPFWTSLKKVVDQTIGLNHAIERGEAVATDGTIRVIGGKQVLQ